MPRTLTGRHTHLGDVLDDDALELVAVRGKCAREVRDLGLRADRAANGVASGEQVLDDVERDVAVGTGDDWRPWPLV